MNKCKKCDVDLDKHRAHLGYTECLECSEVERPTKEAWPIPPTI